MALLIKWGGTIRVYSEPGKGSEFYVYFPVEKSSSEEQSVQPKEPIACGNEQILLVDDEEMILTMEKQQLERLGYQVTSRMNQNHCQKPFFPIVFYIYFADHEKIRFKLCSGVVEF